MVIHMKASIAGLRRALQRTRLSSHLSKTLISGPRCKSLVPIRDDASRFQSKLYATIAAAESPFRSNILRIIRNEIAYQSDYAPPHQPATEFKSFTVEDHPGEQWITMRGKFGEDEQIKMEATMFDGYVNTTRLGLDASGHDVRLHISLLVDISKGDGSKEIEFVCSVWPNRIEIQKLYMLRRNKVRGRPYMGPDFRSSKNEFWMAFREFLRVRGIDSELAGFLHEYMMNKDRIELIQWLRNLESFVKK
ncbi:PREDICTED: uncharacterized protein At2g39795, mitochondrial [Tarenaya hassleriana]|uniref:uncharacterized protein At2g39795, mitochondrial n=1 Tax=Tarenaya hassleriana TaxID=28532 RepID=UPI00053CA499|nr:PREDICTED: uncharacterized protein At2g39795, mitochondrial [Tarenaya hassleriana]